MHSKLSLALMLLAFYQSAVAGSPCPLSVAVANGKDNSIDVTVSNTGKETITVYKGNTVLSGDDTQNTEITQECTFILIFLLYIQISRTPNTFAQVSNMRF